MRKIYKFNKDQKILFCSDFHLNQDKEFLYRGRGFFSQKEHDDWIFSEWERLVDENTIVINFGDAVFRDGKGEKFSQLADLKCDKHYYLFGNHNSGAKQCYSQSLSSIKMSGYEVYPLGFKNVTFLGYEMIFKYCDYFFICHHFPFYIWDGMSGGRNLNPVIMLSGHSHGSDPTRLVESKQGKQLDCGVEVAKKYNNTPFFSIEEILNIMKYKQIQIKDHHDRNVNYSF